MEIDFAAEDGHHLHGDGVGNVCVVSGGKKRLANFARLDDRALFQLHCLLMRHEAAAAALDDHYRILAWTFDIERVQFSPRAHLGAEGVARAQPPGHFPRLAVAANELHRFAVVYAQAVHQAGDGIAAADPLFAQIDVAAGFEEGGGWRWQFFDDCRQCDVRAVGGWRHSECGDHSKQRGSTQGGGRPAVTAQAVDRRG